MALGAIFGALSGLANFGEQRSEATQAARDEIYKRLLEQQNTQAFQTQQQGEQLKLKLMQQPQPYGARYTGQGGKTFQPYVDPLSGKMTDQEVPGPAAETPEQAIYRSMTSPPISMAPADAVAFIKGMYAKTQNIPTRIGWEPDPNHPGMRIGTVYAYDSNSPTGETPIETGIHDMLPRGDLPTETTSYGTNVLGLPYDTRTLRTPVLPGVQRPTVQAPQAPAPYGAPPASQFAAPYGTPQSPFAGPYGAPQPAQTPFAAPYGAPRAPQAEPPAPTPQRPQQAPQGATATPPPGAQGPTRNLGSYHDLDATNHIPMRPGLIPNVVEAANAIIDGADANKLEPAGIQWPARTLARLYGWSGEGSLTPKDVLQIQEPSNIIVSLLKDRKLLQVLDHMDAWKMAAVGTEIPQGATLGEGATRVVSRQFYKTLTDDQAYFMFRINQLRSLMGGFRKLTGGNISEAQVQRYISELPDPVTTTSSKRASQKLMLLYSELQLAQRYGYFPRGESSGADQSPPAAAPPPAGAPATITVTPEDMKNAGPS